LSSRLKLTHLRLIASIDDAGSVSAASQAVNLSQPAASRMIAEIEALLKAEVCQRLSRGVRLTPLGQMLARHAHSILQQLEKAERELEDLSAGRIGVVALGAVTAPAVDIAAQVLNDIRARAPGVELNIEIDNSTALARELIASRLDFIMARAPDEFDQGLFEILPIGVEEALLVVRRSHPLLAKGRAGLAALSEFEWVMQPRGALIRRAIEDLFLAAGIEPPRCLVTTTSITLSLMMSARSDAIAPIALGAAKFATERSNADGLAILPTDFSIVVKPYSLIRLRDRPLSPAASAVYDVIRERALPRV
jgi:molybdate transport repressor ModE-like protein